ncbi:MAG: DUF4342 domain-containing protein [Negativicutes bacterium]|nr:DUF4342 domain-containing protein [Negativicutes bacterium]
MQEITLEKIDTVRERTGVGYRQAKEALERNNGNVIEALIELEAQNETSWTEEFSVRSSEVVEKVKQLIREGNVSRIRVKSEGKTLVEIPVTLGAIGAVVMPQLAALGILVAAFKRCSIEIVRSDGDTETVKTDVFHPPVASDSTEEERLRKGLF